MQDQARKNGDGQDGISGARVMCHANLLVCPEEQLIAVFTACDILGSADPEHEFVSRVLTSVRTKSCGE
jgi:hypothetical protein